MLRTSLASVLVSNGKKAYPACSRLFAALIWKSPPPDDHLQSRSNLPSCPCFPHGNVRGVESHKAGRGESQSHGCAATPNVLERPPSRKCCKRYANDPHRCISEHPALCPLTSTDLSAHSIAKAGWKRPLMVSQLQQEQGHHLKALREIANARHCV